MRSKVKRLKLSAGIQQCAKISNFSGIMYPTSWNFIARDAELETGKTEVIKQQSNWSNHNKYPISSTIWQLTPRLWWPTDGIPEWCNLTSSCCSAGTSYNSGWDDDARWLGDKGRPCSVAQMLKFQHHQGTWSWHNTPICRIWFGIGSEDGCLWCG